MNNDPLSFLMPVDNKEFWLDETTRAIAGRDANGPVIQITSYSGDLDITISDEKLSKFSDWVKDLRGNYANNKK